MGSLFSSLTNISNIKILAVCAIVIALCYFISIRTKVSVFVLMHKFMWWLVNKFGRLIHNKEKAYHRDIEIGKLNDKKKKVKTYRFFDDLIIDLGLSNSGITPYELMGFVLVGSVVLSIIISNVFLGSIFFIILIYPIVVCGVVCMMYTRGNIAHDARIDAVIEAENIICNNIKHGVVEAVKDNIDSIPVEVRYIFYDFVDNVTVKNYFIKTALLELNNKLGRTSDEFIKKCIAFELEEQHGMADAFVDIVETNNMRKELRVEMRHKLDQKITEVKICMAMIYTFLFGVLAIYKDVRSIYFDTAVGSLLFIMDILIFIIIYVITTVVRAAEL